MPASIRAVGRNLHRHLFLQRLGLLGFALALSGPVLARGAAVPPAPLFKTFPLPDTGQVRYLPDGGLEWVGEILTPVAAKRFGYASEVELARWNPATGATHTRDLGIEGFVGPYQLPFDDGTMFLLQQHGSTHPDWSAAWLTARGVIKIPMPTPGNEHSVRLVALPGASVFILERTPDTRHITGHWLRRQVQQLALTPMPELPQAYNGDFAAVALDDHRVMVLGGSDGKYRGCEIASSCRAATWILDLRSRQWNQGPDLLTPRTEAAAFRLPDGSVIVAGGWTPKDGWGPGPTYTAELWNPRTNVFEALPPMPVATARAVAHWLPGHEGRILLFAQGTSSDVPAFNVATHTWFDAGSFGMGSEEGACAFFPFRFKGGFYAWQRYRTEGFYSSRSCESDDALLGALRFPPDVVPLPAPDPSADEVAINRIIDRTGFVPPADGQPALVIGGEAGGGMTGGSPFVAAVDAVTTHGQVFALPPLHHPRSHPLTFRLGDGVLVLGGTAKSVYRRETPKLPPEWLSSIHAGSTGAWQDLDALDVTPNTLVGQATDGSLLALGDQGTLDRISVDVQQGVPHFQRNVWLHLARARSGYGYDAGSGFQLTHKVHARELADGRVILAGGTVQHDKIAVLTDATGHVGQPDAYVSTGGDVSATRFETWSPATRQWTQSPPSPIEEGHWIPLADGRVIEVDDAAINTGHLRVETYDPAAGRWVRGTDPAPMMQPQWFMTQGELLLAGVVRTGPYGSPGMRALQWFHPDTGQWTWLWKDTQNRFAGRYAKILLIQHAADGRTLLIPVDGL